MDHANLTALVRRAQQLGAQTPVPRSALMLGDEKDAALANYRTIAGLCAQAIEQLRPPDGQANPDLPGRRGPSGADTPLERSA